SAPLTTGRTLQCRPAIWRNTAGVAGGKLLAATLTPGFPVPRHHGQSLTGSWATRTGGALTPWRSGSSLRLVSLSPTSRSGNVQRSRGSILSPCRSKQTPAGPPEDGFTVLGAVAELERSLIAERVRAGIRNARAKGKRIGRPRVVVDASR